MLTDIYLAAPGVGTNAGVQTFWNTSAGNVLAMIMQIIGVLIVIGAVVKGVSLIGAGKHGAAAKIFVGSAILAVFLFQPQMIETVIAVAGKMVGAIVNSGGDIVNKGTANGGAAQ